MPTASINGTELHYERLGDQGPPVLLVMGVRARGLAWTPVAERLARDHRVVFWDNRGVGGSRPLEGPTSMQEMADDGVGLMDHLGWATAHVAGVSMGGTVSQVLALRHPERVRSLTLIATTSHGKGLSDTNLSTILRYFSTFFGSPDARLGKLARMLYTEGHIEREGLDEVVARMKEAFGHDHPGTARAQIRAIRAWDGRDELHRVTHPTLVVAAGQDCIVPERHQRLIAERVPEAEYEAFPHALHGVVVEEADALSARVSRLISRVEARVAERAERDG